jgi:hypothetical protein
MTSEIRVADTSRTSKSLLAPFVVVTVVFAALCLALGWPSYRAMQQARSRMERMQRFAFVANALSTCDLSTGSLPDAVKLSGDGTPLYSWRFTLIPFLQGVKNLVDMDAPWTADTNRHFASQRDSTYCFDTVDERSFSSNVAVVVGDRTPFRTDGSLSLQEVPCDTILFMEVDGVGTHWMAPGDLTLPEIDGEVIRGTDDQGVIVAFADGDVWYLDASTPLATFKRFLTVDPTARDREIELGPYKRHSIAAKSECGCQAVER